MAGVKDQWELDFSVGGYRYPAPSPESVPELNWFESVHQSMPTLNMTVKDYTGELSEAAAAGDGTLINITLGDGTGRVTSATFNIQGSPSIDSGRGYYLVKMNAALDAIAYNRSIPVGLYEGTSASVISRLAGEAGLSAITTGTSDNQVWLPSGKTMAEWVKSIAGHGYAGATSAMVIGVTDQRQLVYGDLNTLMQSGSSIFGPLNNASYIPINDWSVTSNGMVGNNLRGYGSTSVEVTPEGIVKELSKISSILLGSHGFLAGLKNIAAVGGLGGRLDLKPVSAGNTHEKYREAVHQNARNRSLFSLDMNILTHIVSGVRLLSGVTVLPPNKAFSNHGGKEIMEAFSGRYLVTAKTKCLTNAKYAERVTCTTNGN